MQGRQSQQKKNQLKEIRKGGGFAKVMGLSSMQ